MDAFWGVVWALAPTILVGLIFWFVIRALVRADKTERSVFAKIEAEERAKLTSDLDREGRADPIR